MTLTGEGLAVKVEHNVTKQHQETIKHGKLEGI